MKEKWVQEECSMKNERQERILQIIRDHDVETQEDLLAYLKDMGISSTQATVTRPRARKMPWTIRSKVLLFFLPKALALCHKM